LARVFGSEPNALRAAAPWARKVMILFLNLESLRKISLKNFVTGTEIKRPTSRIYGLEAITDGPSYE
jgi:hypothetical protein